MIRHVRIEGYKSLDQVQVELAPLTVVFGPNAAGKSNLLDALSLLSRMVTHDTLDAAFAVHRGAPLEAFTLGEGGVEALQQRPTAEFAIAADIELSDSVVDSVEAEIRKAREGLSDGARPVRRRMVVERYLRYTVKVQIVTSSGHLRVMDERLEALKEDGSPRASRKPFLEQMPGERRLLLRMEKQGHPSYEEIGQDRTIVSKPLYPPHYPHIVALREELSRWRFFFLEPAAMREEVALKEVEVLAPNGSDIAAFYNTVLTRNSLQFQALGRALRQVIPTLRGLDIERTTQGFLRLVVDEAGMPLSSRLISEGTLRVLGLLAITNPLKPLSFVGFEEPENGVHARRLAMVAQLLIGAAERGSTQFLINTHSPILPEYFVDVEAARLVHCRKEGRRTIFETFKSQGPLFQQDEFEAALDDEPSTFRDRLVRGDFGG